MHIHTSTTTSCRGSSSDPDIESKMTAANKGAASPLVRWYSFTCCITAVNNLFYALFVYQVMSFASGIERVRCDLLELIDITVDCPSRTLLRLLYFFLLFPFSLILNTLFIVFVLLNEIFRIVEQTICILCYVITLGTSNFTSIGVLYNTAMRFTESCNGLLWHDSNIILAPPRMLCDNCPHVCCKKGSCYTIDVSHPLFHTLNISCECFKLHVQRRMELSREHDGCKMLFEQTDRITQAKLPCRGTSVKTYYDDGCGVFDDTVIERHYDMDISMWTTVTLKTESSSTSGASASNVPTSSTANPNNNNNSKNTTSTTTIANTGKNNHSTTAGKCHAEFSFTRANLDERVTIPIDAHVVTELVQMPQLRYSFLRMRARNEGCTDITFTPLVVGRRLGAVATAILGVRFASKTFHEEVILSWTLIALASVGAVLVAVRDHVSLGDVGGENGLVARMFAMDSMSRGRNLISYGNDNTSLSRHIGYGGRFVGEVTVLENIVFNRAIVMGSKMVALGREGTSMFIADVSWTLQEEDDSSGSMEITDGRSVAVATGGGGGGRSGSNGRIIKRFRASGWRKASHAEVQNASTGAIPNIYDIVE